MAKSGPKVTSALREIMSIDWLNRLQSKFFGSPRCEVSLLCGTTMSLAMFQRQRIS